MSNTETSEMDYDDSPEELDNKISELNKEIQDLGGFHIDAGGAAEQVDHYLLKASGLAHRETAITDPKEIIEKLAIIRDAVTALFPGNLPE